jgi:hypothetical protein
MCLVVLGSCSVLHNDALNYNRNIGCCWVYVASGSIGSAIFDKVVVFIVVCYGIGISLSVEGVHVCLQGFIVNG